MDSDVFGLFNTKHLCRRAQSCMEPAVLRWGTDVAYLPPQDTSMPDSAVWPLTHV
jgi:hypothetical protein